MYRSKEALENRNGRLGKIDWNHSSGQHQKRESKPKLKTQENNCAGTYKG